MNTIGIRTGIAAAALAVIGGAAALAGAGDASAIAPECNPYQDGVASVDTADAAASICQWRATGELVYVGVTNSTGDMIEIPVSLVVPTYGGPGYSYTAVNDGYTYRVDDGKALAITDPDGVLIYYDRQI